MAKTGNGEKKIKRGKVNFKTKHFPCSYCEKTFTERCGRDYHMQLHSSAKPFSCEVCNTAYKTKKYLARHIKNVHQPPSNFQCKYCDRKFHYKSKMEDHLAVHTNSRPHKCTVCGKGFNSAYSLATHILIHKNLKPFKCRYCEYACRDSSTLRRHHDRHKGVVQRFPCDICGNTFSKKHILNDHVAQVHMKMDLKTVPCVQCEKKFKTEKLMTLHVRDVHERSSATSCEICGCKVARKYNMSAHLRTHVDARPYKCAFAGCAKRYKDPSSLKKHAIVHYPEKQFPCAVCGRRFTRRPRMLRHARGHAPRAKTQRCDCCGAKFLYKSNLLAHVRRTHTPQRLRFVCDTCDFEAGNKAGIIMHIRGHYRRANKVCYICEKSYKDDRWLKQHLWNAHHIVQSDGTPTLDMGIKTEPLDADAAPLFELFEIEKEELLEELNSINSETGQAVNIDRTTQNSEDLGETQAIQAKDVVILHKALEQVTKHYTESIPDINLIDKEESDNVDVQNEQNHGDSVTDAERNGDLRAKEQCNNLSVGEYRKSSNRDSLNEEFNAKDKESSNTVGSEHSKTNKSGSATDVENCGVLDEELRINEKDSVLKTGTSGNIVPENAQREFNDSNIIQCGFNVVNNVRNIEVVSNDRRISETEREKKGRKRKRQEHDSDYSKDCDRKAKKNKITSEPANLRNNSEKIENTDVILKKNHTGNDKETVSSAGIKRMKEKINDTEVLSEKSHNSTYIVSYEDSDARVKKKVPKASSPKLQKNKQSKKQNKLNTTHDSDTRIQKPENSVFNDRTRTSQRVARTNNDVRLTKNAIINDRRRKFQRVSYNNDDINDKRRKLIRISSDNDVVNGNKGKVKRSVTKDNQKIRRYSDDEDGTAVEYSRSVLTEDLARCVAQNTENPSEKAFDDFVMENMFERGTGFNDKILELDKDSEAYAKKYLDKLLKETREKKEVKLLERARQQYNERILRAKGIRKEKVAIKYYDKVNKNDPANNDLQIEDGREKNVTDHSNNEKDLSITTESREKDGNNEVGLDNVDNTDNDSNVSKEIDAILHDKDKNDSEVTAGTDTAEVPLERDSNTDSQRAKETDNRLRPPSVRKRKKKCYKDFITDEGSKKNVDESRKIKINMHQCYVCFKLFDTKAKLLDHCKDHFDICNSTILKKCPLCDFATRHSITRHMRLVHDTNITIPSFRIQEKERSGDGSKYFLKVNSSQLQDIDIIPSVKHLNKHACMSLDERNRKLKDTGIAKTKLVKKGNEWIVERKTTTLDNIDDLILPQFEVDEILSVKIESNDYLSRLKKLSRLAKKYNKKMVFPCDNCDKICVNFAALKLHSRRHDTNAKPFRKKVWKHKLKDTVGPKANTADKKSRRVVEIDKIETDEVIDTNRYESPKPVKNKHKCDPELIKFYETNVKGGDVEFWQFLKIFNKMSKENVNDFEDLVDRPEFGIHVEPGTNVDVTKNNTNESVSNKRIGDSEVNKSVKSKDSGKFKRVIRISKKEHERRNRLKQQLRERIAQKCSKIIC